MPLRQLSIGIARESSWNGMEFNDNFRIELEDELQREKEMEMEEKEREENLEMEQRKEEGELPFRFPKPPFSNQQGFTCTFCLSTNDDTAYPFCVCCGVKVS